MAKLQDYGIWSTQDGKVTGHLILCESSRGEANKYARDHSRYWKTRVVYVHVGGAPVTAFKDGKQIPLTVDLLASLAQWNDFGYDAIPTDLSSTKGGLDLKIS